MKPISLRVPNDAIVRAYATLKRLGRGEEVKRIRHQKILREAREHLRRGAEEAARRAEARRLRHEAARREAQEHLRHGAEYKARQKAAREAALKAIDALQQAYLAADKTCDFMSDSERKFRRQVVEHLKLLGGVRE
jgi:hypothetical protein